MIQDNRGIQCQRCLLSAKPAHGLAWQVSVPPVPSSPSQLRQLCTLSHRRQPCIPLLLLKGRGAGQHSPILTAHRLLHRAGWAGHSSKTQTHSRAALGQQGQNHLLTLGEAWGRGQCRTPGAGNREGSEQFSRQGLEKASARGRQRNI